MKATYWSRRWRAPTYVSSYHDLNSCHVPIAGSTDISHIAAKALIQEVVARRCVAVVANSYVDDRSSVRRT